DALAFGASGPTLRGSGVPYDLRKNAPYGKYSQVDFNISVGSTGDCWDRYWVRLEEMRQSLSIIEQLIDNIPEGPFQQLKPGPLSKLKLPEGRFYSEVETARGILGCTIVSTKKAQPHRAHFRTPNFNNLWVLQKIAPGGKLGDLVSMVSSLDIVVPDIDR
ncbi:MAG: NADH-quinone oxidoreductase subunit D, partial [Halobacteriovoraceae bacterium]|nr:NADH-quinone oxidoreductase subunit D [Halobacteriovoraceae bacterium]